jgi:Spy/CpxP family protein refolding chaperone
MTMSWSRTRTLSVVLFVSLTLNLFLAGTMAGRWVGAGGHFGGEGRHWGAKFWLNQALGDEATPKVEAMWEVYRAKLEPMRKAARQSRHAIKAALSADPFDPNAYARPLEDSLNQRTGIRASHHDFMIELTSVLPPEQRVKLAERAGGRRWRHHRE